MSTQPKTLGRLDLDGAELQSFPGEGPAGRGFEVALEVKGLLTIAEGDGGFDSPRFRLCRMRILAGVVIFHAAFKVSSEPGIKAFRVTLRLEDVNREKRISLGSGSRIRIRRVSDFRNIQ